MEHKKVLEELSKYKHAINDIVDSIQYSYDEIVIDPHYQLLFKDIIKELPDFFDDVLGENNRYTQEIKDLDKKALNKEITFSDIIHEVDSTVSAALTRITRNPNLIKKSDDSESNKNTDTNPLLISLQKYENALSKILSRFNKVDTGIGVVHLINSKDVKRCDEIVIDLTHIYKEIFGKESTEAVNTINYYNKGKNNSTENPSFSSIEMIHSILTVVLTRIDRNPDLLKKNDIQNKNNTPKESGKIEVSEKKSLDWLIRWKTIITIVTTIIATIVGTNIYLNIQNNNVNNNINNNKNVTNSAASSNQISSQNITINTNNNSSNTMATNNQESSSNPIQTGQTDNFTDAHNKRVLQLQSAIIKEEHSLSNVYAGNLSEIRNKNEILERLRKDLQKENADFTKQLELLNSLKNK